MWFYKYCKFCKFGFINTASCVNERVDTFYFVQMLIFFFAPNTLGHIKVSVFLLAHLVRSLGLE